MMKEVLIGAVCFGAGYFVATRAQERKYIQMLNQEVKRTKEFFGANYEGCEDPEFMEAAIDAAEAVSEYAGDGPKIAPSVLAQEMERSIINYNKPESLVEEEVSDIETHAEASPPDPDARAPHLITFGEFDEGDLGYEQITMSFFAGDGIVIDEDDNVISPARVEQIIGTDNLNKFGTNTEDPDMDPNVIYVRCERFNMDFEVTRSPGKHSVEVLGETG